MIDYTEYKVNVDGLEKRLGLLGENHVYHLEDSHYANKIVSEYDVIAIEVALEGLDLFEESMDFEDVGLDMDELDVGMDVGCDFDNGLSVDVGCDIDTSGSDFGGSDFGSFDDD